MEKKIKGIVKEMKNFRYHRRHKREAYKALENIESINGELEIEFKQKCNEYAKRILGSKKYAPWLYVYTAMNNTFYEGWIPDNYYGEIIVPKLKGKYGDIANRKSLVNILFQTDYFPDLLYVANGLYITPNQDVLSEDEAIKLLNESNNKIVFKLEGSSQGKGVRIITPGKEFNLDMVKETGNGVYQSFIQQHPFFSEIESNSVATLRMTTAVDRFGKVSLIGSYLRIGRETDKIIQSSSNIRIALDLKSGMMREFAYTPEWEKISKHPDTDYLFKGKTIPFYNESKEILLDLHSKIPSIRIIGWDVVIDEKNQIQIMEFNGGHNDIKFSEATQGPIFKDFKF